MTAVAILVLAIGTSDIVRLAVAARASWRWGRGIGALVGMAVGAILGLLVGLGAWIAVLLVVPLWLLATRPERRLASVLAVGLLAGAVFALLAAGSVVPVPSGPLAEWYAALPYPGLATIPLETAAIVAASVVFLVESANVVVRLALAPIAAKNPAERSASDRTMLFRSPEDLLELPLPGGRLIGPLERILILSLAIAGQFTAIGAVVAAKGIIRFPEISKDTTGGSKAEFFIVGSLASWVLVAAAVALAGLTSG